MMRLYLAREWAAQRTRWIALVIFTALLLWSVLSGVRWQAHTEAILAQTPADLLTDREEWLQDLANVEAGDEVSPYAARPMNYTALATYVPDALAALAFRDEAIHPHTALVSGWRSEASLFRRYEVQGPSALGTGRLDLAFVVIVLLPLLLLVLSFDVLSRERESGRLALFLVQGGSVKQLVLARLLMVCAPLALLCVVGVIAVAVHQGAEAGNTSLWVATILLYVLFWAALAAWIATRFVTTATAALAVLGAWATLVVLIPSAAQFVAEAVYPVPSRVTYLSEARDAEGQTRRAVEERAEIYMAEHPGQADTPDEAVPGFYRSAYLANVDINAQTAPLIAALESQQEKQRRLLRWAGLLSPTIAAQQLLFAASGTGPESAAAFRQQTRAYLGDVLERIGPATVSRARISLADAQAIPEFQYVRAPLGLVLMAALFWLAVLAALVSALAASAFRSVVPVSGSR